MQTAHRAMLTRIVTQVFEDLAFMFVDPAEGPPDLAGGQWLEVRMPFEGPGSGRLALAAPVGLCREAAGNILGLDPEATGACDRASDALKELLNVICGHVVCELFGTEPIIHLGIPAIAPLEGDALRRCVEDPDRVGLCVDDRHLMLALELDPDRPPGR